MCPGTQGFFNHLKLDRMLELAEARRLPVVLCCEGGGGRPGDTDTDLIMSSQLRGSTWVRLVRVRVRVRVRAPSSASAPGCA